MDNARRGFFEPDEFEAVVRELPEPLRNVPRFAYHTRWRSGEIRGLQMADVDWNANTVHLEGVRSKNEEARVFSSYLSYSSLWRASGPTTEAVQKRTGQIVPGLLQRRGQADSVHERGVAVSVRTGEGARPAHA